MIIKQPNKRPPTHVPSYFWKLIFFLRFQRRTHPHVEYSNRFFPSTRKRKNDVNTINISIFPRPHDNHNSAFSKFPLWDRFWCPRTYQTSVYVWPEGYSSRPNVSWYFCIRNCFFSGFKHFHVHTRRIRIIWRVSGFTPIPGTSLRTLHSPSQSFDHFGQRPDADQKDRSFEALGTRMGILATKYAS